MDRLLGDNRPSCYYDDSIDSWVLRASAVGGCTFELVAAGQGLDPLPIPANLLRAFQEGHDLEHKAIRWLEDNGWTTLSQQTELDWEVAPGIVVRMHPDHVGWSPGARGKREKRVNEVKWLSHDNWFKAIKYGVESVVPEYAWQLSCMMYGFDLPANWVYGNKGYAPDEAGVKAYDEDEGRIEIQRVDHPLIQEATIRAKCIEVVEAIRGDDILTSGRVCENPGQWPCRFRHFAEGLGEESEAPDPKILNIQDEDKAAEVDRLVREYLYCKGQVDELEQRRDDAKRALIEIAGGLDSGIKKVVTDKWTVPVVANPGKESLDWAAMPSELRDRIKSFMTPGKKYKYLTKIKRND